MLYYKFVNLLIKVRFIGIVTIVHKLVAGQFFLTTVVC